MATQMPGMVQQQAMAMPAPGGSEVIETTVIVTEKVGRQVVLCNEDHECVQQLGTIHPGYYLLCCYNYITEGIITANAVCDECECDMNYPIDHYHCEQCHYDNCMDCANDRMVTKYDDAPKE